MNKLYKQSNIALAAKTLIMDKFQVHIIIILLVDNNNEVIGSYLSLKLILNSEYSRLHNGVLLLSMG